VILRGQLLKQELEHLSSPLVFEVDHLVQLHVLMFLFSPCYVHYVQLVFPTICFVWLHVLFMLFVSNYIYWYLTLFTYTGI